jgi:hypothetical protein
MPSPSCKDLPLKEKMKHFHHLQALPSPQLREGQHSTDLLFSGHPKQTIVTNFRAVFINVSQTRTGNTKQVSLRTSTRIELMMNFWREIHYQFWREQLYWSKSDEITILVCKAEQMAWPLPLGLEWKFNITKNLQRVTVLAMQCQHST